MDLDNFPIYRIYIFSINSETCSLEFDTFKEAASVYKQIFKERKLTVSLNAAGLYDELLICDYLCENEREAFESKIVFSEDAFLADIFKENYDQIDTSKLVQDSVCEYLGRCKADFDTMLEKLIKNT